MGALFSFLLISLLCTYLIKLKDRSLVFICATLIPFFCVVIYTGILCFGISSNYAKQEVKSIIIPAVISGFVIYFQLEEKIKNKNKVKFPIVLASVVFIAFAFSLTNYLLEARATNLIQAYFINDNSKRSNPKITGVRENDDLLNFTLYDFVDYKLLIPNEMELRCEGSEISLVKTILVDELRRVKKIYLEKPDFVFQPKGMDNVDSTLTFKNAINLYSRVLIKYKKGTPGDFIEKNSDPALSRTEYANLNKLFRNNIQAEVSKARHAGIDIQIFNLKDIEVSKNDYGYVYIQQQYERSGLNGPVKVIDYYLHNNDEILKLTISYRLSERGQWESKLRLIVDSFEFK